MRTKKMPIRQIRQPALIPAIRKRNDQVLEYILENRESCVWKPPKPSNTAVEDFLDEIGKIPAEEEERALRCFYLSDYQIQRALTMYVCSNVDTCNPFTVPEANKFDAAIEEFGKDFNKLKQLFPNRCVKELVQHYYTRKLKPTLNNSRSHITGKESMRGDITQCEAALLSFKIQRVEKDETFPIP